jgi:hypothetical protein
MHMPHFEWVKMNDQQAAENPDCLFVIRDWSADGCYLELASEGKFLTVVSDTNIRQRGYIATVAPDRHKNGTLKIIFESVDEFSLIRMITNTRHHLTALEVDKYPHEILGARAIVKDAKGLFRARLVQDL